MRGRSVSQLYGDGATARIVPDSRAVTSHFNRRLAYVTQVSFLTLKYDSAESKR